MVDKEGILHRPVGELLKTELHVPEALKRDITIPDALKRDITIPDMLKRDIPVGGFLGKEITFRRRRDAVDQVVCFACGRETPSTVSRCLHCEALLEVQEHEPEPVEEPAPLYFRESVCLVDMEW
jgi:hypothetical protein